MVDKIKIELNFWYRAITRMEKDGWPKDALSALRY